MPRSLIEKSRRRPVAPAPAIFRLGYVPLIDAAPLLVSEGLGLFTKAGVNVHLSRELGWGSVREKIVYGELDGAPMPGGLLFSILLGTHAPACAVSTDLVVNLQGNAITLSRRLWEKGVRDIRTFRLVARSEAPRRVTLAVVSPFSSHYFLLREWIRSSGLDPDRDVRIIVLPPALVAENMREGQIDGFCAGEPWNSGAALTGEGWVIATSAMLAPNHPEKVFAVREGSRTRQPEACAALRAALVEACRYCDQPENREAVADLLADRAIFPLSKSILRNSLVGPFHNGFETIQDRHPFISFRRHDGNRATRERALWCLACLTESNTFKIDATARQQCLGAFIEDSGKVRASVVRSPRKSLSLRNRTNPTHATK